MDRTSPVTKVMLTHPDGCAGKQRVSALAWFALGVAGIACGATLGHWSVRRASDDGARATGLALPLSVAPLRADGSPSDDVDGDGLTAAMEAILVTSDTNQDSDGDGF